MGQGIGAAAAQTGDMTVRIERETEPALIFEAMALGRVQRQADIVCDRLGDRAQRLQARCQRAASVLRFQLGQRFMIGSGRRDQRQIIMRAQRGEAAGILAVQLRLDCR